MRKFTLNCEDNPSVSIRVSAQTVVESLSDDELEKLVEAVNPDMSTFPPGDNIFDMEWFEALYKLKSGRYRLSASDEETVKRIADKL